MLDTHLGIDGSSAGGDLDERLSLTSGRRLLAEDLAARLMESPGGLYYDASYGFGLPDYVGESITANDVAKIEAGAAAQCRLDERVLEASCSVDWNARTRRLRLSVFITDAEGPFEFVLSIEGVTGEMLLELA